MLSFFISFLKIPHGAVISVKPAEREGEMTAMRMRGNTLYRRQVAE